MERSPHQIHDQPSEVSAEDGAVFIDGPGHVAVTLTPQAAAETADRIVARACQAAGQLQHQAWAADDEVMRHYGF